MDAASLNADPSKGFVLGGSSAGGSMTAVIGLLARDEKLSPPLTGLCILVPVLLDSRAISEKYKHVIKSYEQNRDAPVLNEKITVLFLGRVAALVSPHSPFSGSYSSKRVDCSPSIT